MNLIRHLVVVGAAGMTVLVALSACSKKAEDTNAVYDANKAQNSNVYAKPNPHPGKLTMVKPTDPTQRAPGLQFGKDGKLATPNGEPATK